MSFFVTTDKVRHKISDRAIGKWKMYKHQLKNIIKRLHPMLKQMEILPFRNTVNWDMEEDWDYCEHLDCSSFKLSQVDENRTDSRPKWLPDTQFDGFGSKIEL